MLILSKFLDLRFCFTGMRFKCSTCDVPQHVNHGSFTWHRKVVVPTFIPFNVDPFSFHQVLSVMRQFSHVLFTKRLRGDCCSNQSKGFLKSVFGDAKEAKLMDYSRPTK